MSSPSPNSGNDSFFTKLETFRRKNKKKAKDEIDELTKEGRLAIESAIHSVDMDDPKHYLLEEGQERCVIKKDSLETEPMKDLLESLTTWINDELVGHRILVRSIVDDLYDGQVLQKLAEKLANVTLDHPEVTQSEFGQMQRLKEVLSTINQLLGVSDSWAEQQWSSEKIHGKDWIAILHLLVALARRFKAGVRLPKGVHLSVIVVRKLNGKLQYRCKNEYITEADEAMSENLDQHPLDFVQNQHLVPEALKLFINAHLQKLQLNVIDLAAEMSDGINLILLMGLLEGYFVPLHCYNPEPTTDNMRIANVEVAFDLMQDAGLPKPLGRPIEIVVGDEKAILRLLYGIYSHYHNDAQSPGAIFGVSPFPTQELDNPRHEITAAE